MFGGVEKQVMKDPKLQEVEPPAPQGLPSDVIISPDTLRENRIPPRQARTRKWPVLDASGPPKIDQDRWRFQIKGLVDAPMSWTWKEFQALPRVRVFSDFHCVTRWSRLGNLWEGVRTSELLNRVKVLPHARYVLVSGYDWGWTTNMPVGAFFGEDVLFADTHDGEAIPLEHGGPLRLIVPRLYAWKSAKWVSGIQFLADDKAGFWEQGGYHMNGDPWREERYR
jgi:DMSO/TMAO reductase YedYZ molybdopterin-dependent catalytic subunit